MTLTEFKRAAARNGFKPGLLGLVCSDIEGRASTSYGYVLRKKRGEWKVCRRESLAKAINDHERDRRNPT